MIKKVIIKVIEKLIYKKLGLQVNVNYEDVTVNKLPDGKSNIIISKMNVVVVDDQVLELVDKIK